MRFKRWQIISALSLLIASALIYILDYVIFGDIHHILVFLLEDIAFLPIEVLLVTLIIHRLLSNMEKRNRLEKLNMVIGAFYVQVGTSLLAYLSDMDPNLERIRSNLMVTSKWSDIEFSRAAKSLEEYRYGVDINSVDLTRLNLSLSK